MNLESYGYQLKPLISPSNVVGCHSTFRHISPGHSSTQKNIV